MSDNRVVLALGYFDSVHIGHLQVLDSARDLASKLSAKIVVFTFSGNLKKALNNENGSCIFLHNERNEIFSELGYKDVFFAPTTKEFLALDKRAFLDYLNDRYNICAYACGTDYKFGKNGLGDAEFLKEYAKDNDQQVQLVDIFQVENQKVSTTLIKHLLSLGEIEKANNLLGRSYFVSGKVVSGRKVGCKIGFPTINLEHDIDKIRIKEGVYLGHIYLDGVRYKTIINYGTKPTFEQQESNIEAHILDYQGNLYGKSVKLYFDGYLRDIIKFDNSNQLCEQLKKDIDMVRERNYD